MPREPMEEEGEDEVRNEIPASVIEPPPEDSHVIFNPEIDPTTGLFDQPELPAFEETNAFVGSPRIQPDAPARTTGHENGCRDLPPPEFPPVEAMEEDLHMDLPPPPQPMDIPPADLPEEPEMSLGSLPDAEPPRPKRRKKAAKKSKLIVDPDVQIDQDLMRTWREETDTLQPLEYPEPGRMTCDTLLNRPLHMTKASKALQNSLKRAYMDKRYEENIVQDEEVVVAPDMPVFEEPREAPNALDEEDPDDSQSTIRGASRSRLSNLDLGKEFWEL